MTTYKSSETANEAEWMTVDTSTTDHLPAHWRKGSRLTAVQVTPSAPSFDVNSQRLLTILNTWPSLVGATLHLGYAHVTPEGAAAEALYWRDGRLSRFTYRLQGRQESIGHGWVEELPWQEPVVARWVAGDLVHAPFAYRILADDGWMQLYTRLEDPVTQVGVWKGGRWQRFLRWLRG